MNWYKDLRISLKLIIGFIIVAVIAGIVGLVGIVNINSLAKSDLNLYNENLLPLNEAENVSTAFQMLRVSIRTSMLLKDKTSVEAEIEKINNDKKIMDDAGNKLQLLLKNNAKLYELSQEFLKSKDDFYLVFDDVLQLVTAGKVSEAMDTMSDNGSSGIASKVLNNSINKLTDELVIAADATSKNNTKQASGSILIMTLVIFIGVLVAITLGILISKIISKPMLAISNAASKISEGDIDLHIDINTKDELGNLANSMKLVIKTLKSLVDEAGALTKAAVEGKINTRGKEKEFSGAYKEIVNGVNRTLDALVGHIDEMPAPVVIVDKEFGIKYMNKLAAEIVGLTQQQVIGKKCYELFKTSDCNNSKCACMKAMQTGVKSTSETDAHPRGVDLEISYTGIPIKDDVGNVLGAVELIVDQTSIKKASRIAEKQAKLQQSEVGKLLVNLESLAEGKLDLNFENIITDEDTKSVGENFEKINKNLAISADSIKNYIYEITSVLGQMSNSNMDVEVSGDYKGDFSPIKESLNMIIATFNKVLGEMNTSAEQVLSGSRQVSEGSQVLSQGATEQASSIEELTASITQIASQTKQNAGNANLANDLASNAKENAINGNKQMKEMLNSMTEISESSLNISKIIKVIDDIAFQTNILALNAAVEAARAGQHGKGFAVVAEEVRNLAARSANAAKETTALIEGSIKKVESGTKIANETATALDQIVDGVEKAANLVGNIATASNEQATGIAQINKGIEQVSQVVQTNSATAEESASASEELSSQAQMLKELVARFNLKRNNSDYYMNMGNINPEIKTNKVAEIKVPKSKKIINLDDKDFGKY